MAPVSEPAGRAEQASPSFCNWVTSRSGAGEVDTWGPLLNRAWIFCRFEGAPGPFTCTAW